MTPPEEQTPKITFKQYLEAHPELTPEQIAYIETHLTEFLKDHPEIIVTLEDKEQVKKDLKKAVDQIPAAPGETPTVEPELVIKRTEFPKWWKGLSQTKIDLLGTGSQIIIPWLGGAKRHLMSINFVCDGETDLYLQLGYVNITGPMSFGGSDEPRGSNMDHSNAPIPCGSEIMSLYSENKNPSPQVQVSGIAVYYTEPKE